MVEVTLSVTLIRLAKRDCRVNPGSASAFLQEPPASSESSRSYCFDDVAEEGFESKSAAATEQFGGQREGVTEVFCQGIVSSVAVRRGALPATQRTF